MANQASMKTIDDTAFAVAEFSSLRDEILKRIEIQNQIVNLALVIAGSIVSFGFGFRNGAFILPIYPVIAFGLAASWEQHNLRIRQLGRYIREKLEPRTSEKGWEQYRFDEKVKRTGTAFIARATFMFTQLGIIVLTSLLSTWPLPPISIILFVMISLLYLLLGLLSKRTHYGRKSKPIRNPQMCNPEMRPPRHDANRAGRVTCSPLFMVTA